MNKLSEDEENYLPVNMNETSQSSPLLSYKLDKYSRFYHPLESPLINLQSLDHISENPDPSNQSSPLLTPSLNPYEEKKTMIRKEFIDIHIREVILSPSPRSKKKVQEPKFEEKKNSNKLKTAKSCLFGIFKKKDSKELKKWWINSQFISIIATNYHSFKYMELPIENPAQKCLAFFKKFPKLEDLSINIETFAELGVNNTILIRNLITMRKITNILDLRIVSFPGEKTLWHGPAFLFNSVMGFNMREEDNESSNNRFEIWHRFRSYFDRGAYQEELMDILNTINIRLKDEKIEVLHLILASNLRITDKLLKTIEETLNVFLKGLSEFKLLVSGRNMSNDGIKSLCETIETINPRKIKSFHFLLDYRSTYITEIGILSVCRTILKLAEINIIEYLSLGFLSNNLKDNEMTLLGDALRLLSKTLRSLVLIISGNMTNKGLLRVLEGVLEGPYLKKICLGFMGMNIEGNKKFMGYLIDVIEKKARNGGLYLFHLYLNDSSGVRNEMIEGFIKEKIGIYKEIDLETYIFF